MSFTTFSGATNIISQLDDRPNDIDGLSASQLKAKFDKIGGDLKTFINDTLIAELEAATAGASIGVSATGITASTLNGALEELLADIASAVVAGLSDDCVQTSYIQDSAVTAAKLASSAVETAKLKDANVTTAKLADGSVTTAKLTDANVTTGKLADAAVTTAKLGASAVTTAKIADANVTTAKIDDGAVTYAKTSGVQQEHTATTASVPAISAGGYQTVSVTGVTATNTVLVTPAPADFIKWRDCGVRCTEQSAGTLKFEAESATGQTLTANIVILN